MRKLIFTLLLTGLAFLGQAQTVVFSEDFETVPPPGISSNSSLSCFDTCTRLQAGGLQCDSTGVSTGGVCVLETNPFDTQNNFFVTLSFANIAKLEFFDAAELYISTDGGFTWTKLEDNQGGFSNCTYLGTGLFRSQNSKFQEANYVNWNPGQPTVPDNSYWHTELFDISAIAGGYPDVRLRFVLSDLNSNGLGLNGKGWFIDDVEVVASFCELIPPNVQATTVYSNSVYYLGPYTVNATATDASGIAGVILNWTLNGAPQPFILMGYVADSTYTAQIPMVNDSDVVCYQIQALDGSFCSNISNWPDPNDPNAYQCFTAYAGVTYPYCDNFETQNIWTEKILPGGSLTEWQLGQPSFAPTNTTHSGVRAWDTDTIAGYLNNANCQLLSPSFSGLIAGSTLSFWQNRQVEGFWDGVRLEYATDTVNGPWTLLGSVGCIDCVNWYTNGSINSSGLPAWDGSSNGWIQSSIILDATFNSLPQVWFRFVFTSDGSVTQAGFSIDDFCMALPQPEDVGVTTINIPGTTGPAGNSISPEVIVKNYGINPQTTFPVEYTIDTGSGPVVTGSGTYTGNLGPGATATVTLSSFIVPTGTYTLCAYTQLPGDGNNYNDTTCLSSLGIPVLTLTSCDDFESGNLGWQDSTTNATAVLWQLGTPAFGATTGAYNGTNAWDINLNSGYGVGGIATLNTPIYDLNGAINPYLSFYRNQNSGASDGLRVWYRINGAATWTLLGTVNDPDGTNWYNTASINFGNPGFGGNSGGWQVSRYYLNTILQANPTAQYIQFQFQFESNFNNVPNDGVSIDNFCVVQPSPIDVGVTVINEPPGSSPAGSTQNVNVNIRNFGTAAQTNVPVEVVINPGPIVLNATYIPSIAPGQEVSLFVGSFTVPSGQYCAEAYTQLAGDGDASNDTTDRCVIGVPTIPLSYTNPYCDDFEGTNVGWYTELLPGANPISNWELGTPAFGTTNSAHSGLSAWDVNLTSAYGPNAACVLTSPYFDLQNAVDPKISFWHQWREENNWDGVRMEYQTNNSGVWNLLGGFGGTFTPPNWIGWYNLASIISSGQPAWTNTGPGWVNSQANDLNFLNGNLVQFRYIFTSDGSVQQDGHTIDDFCLIVPVPLTAAPLNVQTNTINSSFIFPGQTVQFSSLLSNPGTTALDSVDVTLTINGVPFVTDSTVIYTTPLAAGANQLLTFLQNWQAAPGVYDICVITSNPNGMPDLNPFDDTTCITISVFDSVTVTSANPYCTDFESGPQWVSVNSLTYNNTPGNEWQLGTPSQTILNGAHSGTNAWMVNLTNDYQNRDSSGLFTPVFAVDSINCYELSFWHKYDSEPFADGGTVEYSVDNAQTWNQLGFASSQPQPWYNTPFITALGGSPGYPGWSGTESNWVTAMHEINFSHPGTVIFRFRFASDNTVNSYEGWVIDDVCFKQLPTPCVTGINDPTAQLLMLDQNYPNPFNGVTTIGYSIPASGHVKINITNLLGQEIAVPVNSFISAGNHTFDVSSKSMGAGIYYYTLEFEGQKITRKMVITE
ncbi:MAG TPA: CARDB domain-containing protein [Bacteroidia bacterium]|nr:CARDB domain-containing protein [Bacteroidia bacterium]